MNVDRSVAKTVYTLFRLCRNKLTDEHQAYLDNILNLDGVTSENFYSHISNIVITTVNTEVMAVKKAVKSKVLSWYKREYKKVHQTVVQNQDYEIKYVPKERSAAGPKVEKKVVSTLVSPLHNNNWAHGITFFCLQLVSVGLASFGTFAGYFFYYDDAYNGYYVIKLMTDKESGGKKIVFVKN